MCHTGEFRSGSAAEVTLTDVHVQLSGGTAIPVQAAQTRADAAPVVVCSDIFGRSAFHQGLAAELATAGFRALLPDLFHHLGDLPESTHEAAMARRLQLDEGTALDELGAVVDWARQGDEPVGVVGFCLGGTLALGLTARRPNLATVCFYGFPAGTPPRSGRSAPAPLEIAGQLRGPILGFWGEADDKVGIATVTELGDRLVANGIPHELHLLPGLGHGFMSTAADGDDQPERAAATTAWSQTVAFFTERLASTGPWA